MKAYQQEYLALLRDARTELPPSGATEPEAFVQFSRARQQAIARGTQLLRQELFPVLDDILAAPRQEVRSIGEFAGQLMAGGQQDVGLHYRIHLALMDRARQRKERDELIRELYLVGMSLYNLETMLSPNPLRLYTSRMRMCFAESASYFDTEYDDIQDPEIRGYIHRSMGNIALSYTSSDPASSRAKLAACTRSIRILSDPEIRAKTPSLPWDTFLYKSHQERTTLLSYLRSGMAEPDAFAQVLESAQTIQQHQLQASRERGEPLQPRWQYAYMAARFHCGAMLLPEMLEGLYSLSTAGADNDFGFQSMFSHASAPALYLEYVNKYYKDDMHVHRLAARAGKMTRRLFPWLVRLPDSDSETPMFFLRQFLYVYRERLCGIPFFDALQNVFAVCHPATYARMWIAGQAARQLALWAAEDCPERLVGLPGFKTVEDVTRRSQALGDFACQAGRLYDAGIVHFFSLENAACRGLFEEEEALLQLHVHCGWELLSRQPSTAVFADVARGHHRRFDEKGGYPVDFSISSSPMGPMICLIAVADALVSSAEETASRYRPYVPYETACARLREGSGTRYAPFAVSLLNDPARREQMGQLLERWKKDAFADLYRRREQMAAYQE